MTMMMMWISLEWLLIESSKLQDHRQKSCVMIRNVTIVSVNSPLLTVYPQLLSYISHKLTFAIFTTTTYIAHAYTYLYLIYDVYVNYFG